ncbi:hypothetical protein [Mycoplasma sp. P36-A1]|uniref:hypothetical protein n=1 Tax=Mycoplasma sp. P36-A1 TaxID=3252900 RepID=UPI003C2E4E59
MNKKVSYIQLLVIPLLVFALYYIFMQQQDTIKPIDTLFKKGIMNDCYHNIETNEKMVFVNLDETKLTKANNKIVDEYQYNKCVKKTAYNYEEKIILNDVVIKHQKGTNNTRYQYSYVKLLELLKNSQNKTNLSKKIINVIEYLNDSNQDKIFVPVSDDHFMYHKDIIGASNDDTSGNYYLTLNTILIKNDIYELKNNEKVFKNTVYTFDSIEQTYEKAGK